MKIPFSIETLETDEVSHLVHPEAYALEVASIKSEEIWQKLIVNRYEKPFLICSDTIVCLEDKIYGKPTNVDDARRILLELSGKKHTVKTAVNFRCLIDEKVQFHQFVTSTEVEFYPITKDILDIYLDSGESLDKAGAYGIQGESLVFIKSLNGSYSNVVGLPIAETIIEIKKFLKVTDDKNGDWRKLFYV